MHSVKYHALPMALYKIYHHVTGGQVVAQVTTKNEWCLLTDAAATSYTLPAIGRSILVNPQIGTNVNRPAGSVKNVVDFVETNNKMLNME